MNHLINTLIFSSSRRIAVLRGSILLSTLFVLVSLALGLLISPEAENFQRAPDIPALLVIIISAFLVLVLPRTRGIFLFALLSGGTIANWLESHLFSPVSDYLLIPGTADHYFNLADLGIILGPLIYALFGLIEFIRLEKAEREKHTARAAPSL